MRAHPNKFFHIRKLEHPKAHPRKLTVKPTPENNKIVINVINDISN